MTETYAAIIQRLTPHWIHRRASSRPDAPPATQLSEADGRELKPYLRNRAMRLRPHALIALSLFCFLYGSVFAFFAPYFMVPLIAPLAVLVGIALWSLPETARAPVRALEFLFSAFIAAIVMWPNYLALALPGLPWITVLRLIGLPLALALLTCVSVSAPFRSELNSILRTAPSIWKMECLFVLFQVVSIAFSAEKGASADALISVLTNWTALFFASAFVLAKPGRAQRFVRMLCVMSVGLGVIAFWEQRVGHLPWAGHIPSFLQVNDPAVQRILAGTARLGKTQYRSQATFGTSLGLSQYLALTMPFLFHFATTRYPATLRVAAILAVPFILLATVFTQARVGLVGILVAFLTYPLVRGFLYWRRHPRSVLAAAIVFMSPALPVLGLAVAYIVPGLHVRIFGGGAEKYSTQARWDQLHLGLPKILSHPWGYGIARGGYVLDYRNAAGMLTIDSYTLRIVLDYGIIGALVYYGIFLAAFVESRRRVVRADDDDRDAELLVPTTIALLSFLVMQTAFAQEDNQPIIFAFFGLVTALISRSCSRNSTLSSQPQLTVQHRTLEC